MIKSLIFTMAGLLVAVSPATAEDSLLSDVRIDSVYESATDSSRTLDRKRKQTVRVRGTERLSELLREAGFDVTSSENRMVKTTKKLDRWSFPVLVTITEDERSIGITLALSSDSDTSRMTTEMLLGLMEVNRIHAPSQFLYSKTRKRTELFCLLDNDGVTGQILRDEINRLAVLAKENETVWRIAETPKPATTPRKQVEKSTTPVATAPSTILTGSWSAARSDKEAFAIRFKSDGTFLLIYIKDSKQTRSSGKFTQDAQSLTLEGKGGLRLTGTFSSQSEQEFRFQPKNSTALTFRKAE